MTLKKSLLKRKCLHYDSKLISQISIIYKGKNKIVKKYKCLNCDKTYTLIF